MRARPSIPRGRAFVFVGHSAASRTLDELIDRVAGARNTTVLLTGESGAGKELVARAIHDRSERREGPFLGLNCAAVSEDLLEAELFGHEAGAFTGAAPRGRAGLLAQAAGGTLLLDEIGELALGVQAKLLRVLQERSFRPVGSSREEALNARVIAATNRDLEAMVAQGRFRDDLYYRLNVMQIRVPSLRERREDIEPLAQLFLAELAGEMEREAPALNAEARAALRGHDWPGNVRELRNSIERAMVLARGPLVRVDDLGLPGKSAHVLSNTADELSLGSDRSLRALEARWIRRVLADEGGNRSRAARALGINRATLYHKLRAYGIAGAGNASVAKVLGGSGPLGSA
jgi:transcriptional regulator with PAS, ATPase and Fis domain